MSSVDWKKLHNGTTEMIAMISHASRYDGNPDINYRNKYIDKEKTHLNYTVGTDSNNGKGRKRRLRFGGSRFFEIMRLQNRMKEIDLRYPPQRRRKDRVTAIAFCVPKPEGFSDANEEDFFKMAYEKIAEICGGSENVSIGYVHKDEIHRYTDAVTGEEKISLAHMHCTGLPFVSEKGLNGRLFMCAERMSSLNEAIDRECRNRFGCRFLTGVQSRSGRSVEDLQLASEKKTREISREQEKRLQKKIEETKKAEERLEKQRDRIAKEEEKIKENYARIAKMYNSLLTAYKLLKEKAEELKIAIDDHELAKTLKEILR